MTHKGDKLRIVFSYVFWQVLLPTLSAATTLKSCHIPLQVVSEDQDFYNVVQMAEFLYGEVSPATCYSAHRLLNEDRTYFKQVGRVPPVFQARPAAEVAKLQAQAAAEKKVRTFLGMSAGTAAVLAALGSPDDSSNSTLLALQVTSYLFAYRRESELMDYTSRLCRCHPDPHLAADVFRRQRN